MFHCSTQVHTYYNNIMPGLEQSLPSFCVIQVQYTLAANAMPIITLLKILFLLSIYYSPRRNVGYFKTGQLGSQSACSIHTSTLLLTKLLSL